MTVKAYMKRVLGRLGIYQRIKCSCWYDLYWWMVDRSVIDDRAREVKFFRHTLDGLEEGSLIFDIGANRGYKTGIFLRLGARVVAVDPDPSNHEALRQSFQTYRFRNKPVVIVERAVSDHRGVSTLWLEAPGSGKNTLNSKWVETLRSDATRFGHSLQFEQSLLIEMTTIEDLIREHGRPAYIKIDVEGHEVNVLAGMRTPVPYVSFEANLPEFVPEAVQCIDLLEGLMPEAEFNYTTDCRKGMKLEQWVGGAAFKDLVRQCCEPSIEIFCRALAHRADLWVGVAETRSRVAPSAERELERNGVTVQDD